MACDRMSKIPIDFIRQSIWCTVSVKFYEKKIFQRTLAANNWFYWKWWYVFAADIKPDASIAWWQVTFAAGADACSNSRATEGCLWAVKGTQWQFRGHVDPEIQHTVAIFLVVLRLLSLWQYLFTSSMFCLCMIVMHLLLRVSAWNGKLLEMLGSGLVQLL